MKFLLRNILALLAGVVMGVVLITVFQLISVKLYPVPAGFDPKNAEMMRQYAASLPRSAYLLVLFSYLTGFTAAVFLATRLSGSDHSRQGALIAAFFGAASFMNLRAFPHPVWFWVANGGVLLFAVWAGIRFGHPKPAAPGGT